VSQATGDLQAQGSSRRSAEHFLTNVLWSWTGVASNLALGVLLSPYMISSLGSEAYGLWALVFSLVEYFWILDAGLRSAVVNFVARDLEWKADDSIRATMTTAFAVYSVVCLIALAGTALLSLWLPEWFHVSPAHKENFRSLVLLIGIAWALSCLSLPWRAALEAHQLFPVVNRIWIGSQLFRVTGSFAVLYAGQGLVALGWISFCSQILVALASVAAFRRAQPSLTISFALANRARLTEMSRYGAHTMLSTIAQMGIRQGPPVLIGAQLPAAFVGYFSIPSRLMEYLVDAISRVGSIANPNAAALAARGEFAAIARQGVLLNRYCFSLFLPMGIFLLVLGKELLQVWVPAFVPYSAPLILPLVLGTAWAVAGQYVSASLLFGLAKHAAWARLSLAEALVLVPALFWALSHYGLPGAAWVSTAAMILFRGLAVPWYLCQSLHTSFPTFLFSIYARPLFTALPVAAAAYTARHLLDWGHGWFQLAAAAAAISGLFLGAAFFTTLEPAHRQMLWSRVRRRPL
jgi:O-antigen/teichoic acid export membrane protein